MNFLIHSMQIKLGMIGVLSLFLFILVPVYAEVTEISIEKGFYTIEEGIVFVGTEDEGNKMISIIMMEPNGKESYLVGAVSNSEGIFETIPKNVNEFFSTIGTYQFTAFTMQKNDGVILSLEFDGSKVLQPTKAVLQLNSIQDKIIEVEKTVTFTVSITDNSFINPVYTLDNAPVDAKIDPITGKFVWTPSKSHGNIEDVIYNFDVIVNVGNQEDRQNVSIIVKKAYEQPVVEPKVEPVVEPKVEPVVEPKVEPVKSTMASFVDESKDPQHYIDRYNNEPTYKEWFDENYSQYSSIYEAVGLEEPEFGICGDGTKLIDGICTIIKKINEKPWWQFW